MPPPGKYVQGRDAATRKRHRQLHRDRDNENRRKRHAENRDLEIAKARAYRAQNKDKIREQQRRYRARIKADPERLRQRKTNQQRCSMAIYAAIKADPERMQQRRERNARSNLTKFGITLEDYRKLHKAQDGKCAVCRKPETSTVKGVLRKLAVDHCHRTKAVRGLLCYRCNVAIGLMGEDAGRLKTASEYLTRAEGGGA